MVQYLKQIVFIQDYIVLQIAILLLIYVGMAVVVAMIIGTVTRKLAHFSDTDLDNKVIDCLQPAISFTIIGVASILTLKEFDIQHRYVAYYNMVLWSFILLSWLVRLRKAAQICVESFTANNSGIGKDLVFLIHKIFIIVLVVLGGYLFLSIWHVNFTPLLASAGIAGIAIAMAAKDTLANFFGGISLFLDKTYKVGDYIIVDDKDRGEVVSLGIRSTRILTRNDVLVTVPNNILANSRIVNETAPYAKYRVKIPVGVAYGSDLDLVEEVLLKIAGINKDILANPAPRVRIRALADSAVNFELMVWVRDPRERGRTIHTFLKAIHDEFNRQSINIPFPQMDVHLEQVQ